MNLTPSPSYNVSNFSTPFAPMKPFGDEPRFEDRVWKSVSEKLVSATVFVEFTHAEREYFNRLVSQKQSVLSRSTFNEDYLVAQNPSPTLDFLDDSALQDLLDDLPEPRSSESSIGTPTSSHPPFMSPLPRRLELTSSSIARVPEFAWDFPLDDDFLNAASD